jgi:Ca2+-binding EF-hand superfamily protein
MSSINGISGYMSYAYTQGITSSQRQKGPEDLFNNIDSDGSGKVSATELSDFVSKMSQMTGTSIDTTNAMTTYDKDGDGELSSTEIKGFLDANRPKQPPMGMMGMPPGPSPEEKFNEADTDGSGGLNSTELDSLISGITQASGTSIDTTNAMATYDKDGDGELSMDEVQSFLDASGVRPPAPPRNAVAGTGTDSSTDDLLSSLTDSTISTYDADNDGSLSDTELKSFFTDSFSKFSPDFIFKALSTYASTYAGASASSVSLDA